MLDAVVERLLSAAMSGATVPRSALIELAGAVQRVAERAAEAAPRAPQQRRGGPCLKVVK